MSMSRNSETPPSLSPAVFHILLALAGCERHGYAIMKEVADQASGKVRIGPGTLYRSIQNLLSAGWIEEAGERPDPTIDDERRRYYRLTRQGRDAASVEAKRLSDLVRVARMRRLLGHQSPTEGVPNG